MKNYVGAIDQGTARPRFMVFHQDARVVAVDTVLLSNLTRRAKCGVHITGVPNASRTQLLSPKTLDWDEKLLASFLLVVESAAGCLGRPGMLRILCAALQI